MKPGCLSEYFDGIAWKRLTAGEIRHQHEINGDRGLRELFGEQKRDVPGLIIFVADTEEDVVEDVGLNWGNRREGKPRAPEWRLYYTPNSVMGERVIGGEIQVTRAETGDSIFVARSSDRVRIDLIVAPRESTVELQLLWLFGIGMAAAPFVITRRAQAAAPAPGARWRFRRTASTSSSCWATR